MDSKYKDVMGRFRTESLFLERPRNAVKLEPVFTLKDYDHKGLPSMKRLYLEANDPTEYIFASEVLGSYRHWEKLSTIGWFQKYVKQWRKELELQIKADSIEAMRTLAAQASADSVRASALRWLASNGWEKKTPRRGRPSERELRKKTREALEEGADTQVDFERLGLLPKEKMN